MRLFVACEDAGGARAIAPVVAALSARGDALHFLVTSIAKQCLEEAGVTVPEASIEDEAAIEEALSSLRSSSALLSTSTCWGLRLEARAVAEARRAGVPSMTFVDFPTRLRERLSYPSAEDWGALGDRALVVDDVTRDELVALGVPPARVRTTGSPAHDRVFAVAAHTTRREPEPFVLFLSQPIDALYGADPTTPGHPGYTERIVLRALAPLVRERGLSLVVRPHPREDADALAIFARGLGGELDASGELGAIALRARVVVGMSTAGLLETALLGAPTISAELGLKGDDPVPSNRYGLTRLARSEAELRALLDAALASPTSGAREAATRAGLRPGATARVLAELDALATSRGSS